MDATEELDTAGRLARELEEITKIEAALDANPEAQRSLADLRVRLIDLQPTVRLSVAADLLEISLPTIRAWMEDGPLREAGDSSPRRVSLESVLEVRPVLRDLRALGQDRNLLAAVTDRLEDERDLADPELQRSLEEMRRGDLIDVTPSRRRESSS
jgi:DNA-binding transcriptional MerR regulator